jgi:hypothetical protein
MEKSGTEPNATAMKHTETTVGVVTIVVAAGPTAPWSIGTKTTDGTTVTIIVNVAVEKMAALTDTRLGAIETKLIRTAPDVIETIVVAGTVGHITNVRETVTRTTGNVGSKEAMTRTSATIASPIQAVIRTAAVEKGGTKSNATTMKHTETTVGVVTVVVTAGQTAPWSSGTIITTDGRVIGELYRTEITISG